jgi:hypothetical protein
MTQHDVEFPVIAAVEGGATDDGQFVLLQLLMVEGGPIRFSLRPVDLESFVTYLLRIAANLGGGTPSDERVQYQPIPISGVSAGELADGMGCLGVTVGGARSSCSRCRRRHCPRWPRPCSRSVCLTIAAE